MNGFPANTVKALRYLSSLQRAGRMLVTTTRRLLEYCELQDAIRWEATADDDAIRVSITRLPQGLSIQGLSFIVPHGRNVQVFVDKQRVESEIVEASTGGSVCRIPWQPLAYPL